MMIGSGADENVLYTENNQLYRHIPINSQNNRWRQTSRFVQSDLFQEIQNLGYVPKHTLVQTTSSHHIYAVEECWPLIRYDTESLRNIEGVPVDEMIPEQVLSILNLACKINAFLKEQKSNILLSEAHPWNFSIYKGSPVLLDIGAFDDLPGSIDIIKTCFTWVIRRLGLIDFQQHINMINSNWGYHEWCELSRIITTIKISHNNSTWQDYSHSAANQEAQILSDMMKQLQPSTLIDLGGGNGLLSSTIAPSTHIICVDDCKPALSLGFQRKFGNIDFACVDICDKYHITPSRFSLDASWVQRFQSDALLASSIVHHMLRRVDIEFIAKLFNNLARRYILVEFIKHTDPHVSWYGKDISFEKLHAALPNWNLVNKLSGYEAGASRDHRDWYILIRK